MKESEEFLRQPGSHERILQLFEEFPETTKALIERFRRSFPDFKSDGLVCAGVVTFGTNGMASSWGKNEGLVFGLDVITRNHEDLALLFSHEFFHVWHGQASPALARDSKNTPFIRMLFVEGLATYASGELNLGTRRKKYFDDELRDWCESGEYRKFIGEFVRDREKADGIAGRLNPLETTLKQSPDAEKRAMAQRTIDRELPVWLALERKWFKFNEKPAGMPYRAAYCIGDKVVEDLVKRGEVTWSGMSKWDYKTVEQRTMAVLDRIRESEKF